MDHQRKSSRCVESVQGAGDINTPFYRETFKSVHKANQEHCIYGEASITTVDTANPARLHAAPTC